LAAQLPLHSRLGGTPDVSDDTENCYFEAVAATLALLNSGEPVADSVETLLDHFDNDLAQVESLLVSLLRNRDQWLLHIFRVQNDPAIARQVLQDNLRDLVEESLAPLRELLRSHEQLLCELVSYAAGNLAASGSTSRVIHCQELKRLPQASLEDLPVWQGLADFLLNSQSGSRAAWRRPAGLNVKFGFPPGTDKAGKAATAARKAQFAGLVEKLELRDGLLQTLDYARLLPGGYPPGQWRILTALTQLLPLLSAQLSVAFARHNVVDHSQIAQAALDALGSEDEPTDLALVLDYQIHHILVDEFQDTSSLQIRLLERLTAGWQADDGRSLFIVGDGMQSCYAFRNANVGLFIAAREQGIGATQLVPLDLATNFRSSAGVVDWVNRIFRQSFPTTPDITRGAVTYTQAAAFHPPRAAAAVSVRAFSYAKDEASAAWRQEAAAVVERIQQLRKDHRDESIAILVRARSHLTHIIPALRVAGIAWLATEIDRLSSLPVIGDLLSLTRALHNNSDRLAWLSVLRAPWIGLEAHDLLAVARLGQALTPSASHSPSPSLPRCLLDGELPPELSDFARQRLTELRPVLAYALHHAGRQPLHRVVNAVWHLLRGPLLARDPLEQSSAELFFQLMRAAIAGQAQLDMEAFSRLIREQFVSSNPTADDREAVQIMTIHKAKGLEFDHVILPGLSRKSVADDKPLLVWHERINRQGEDRLLLATRGAAGGDDDALYTLLRHERQRRQRLENTRLMYIAVTRACHSALLLGALQDKEGVLAPPADSLLATVWEALQAEDQAPEISALSPSPGTALPTPTAPLVIRRWATPVRLTAQESACLSLPEPLPQDLAAAQADLGARLQAEAGTLIHLVLQNHVEGTAVITNPADLDILAPYWRRQLQGLADSTDIEDTLGLIRAAVTRTLAAPELAWIFQPRQPGTPVEDNACELALQVISGTALQTYRIDRVVRDAQGQLWIIDYKSATPPAGMSRAEFIRQQQELYRGQLDSYRRLLGSLKGTSGTAAPIRTALLLTALPALTEIDA
ncbi:MAG: hypothetical protein RLZZ385_1411, partial [Pseudomonadota bacterium]